MKRLKKHIFLKLIYATVGVLFVIRLATGFANSGEGKADEPEEREYIDSLEGLRGLEGLESQEDPAKAEANTPSVPLSAEDSAARAAALAREALQDSLRVAEVLSMKIYPAPAPPRRLDMSHKHPIMSVPSYATAFPDLQDTHFAAASLYGVRPVRDREEAEHRKSELVYIAANPFFRIDSAMHRSIPYLIPRASLLLHDIARAFIDSLAVKHIPPHTIIVTSVLRTEEDVARLRRVNGNASEQSCHRFGTTFDISYYRFHTVCPPGSDERQDATPGRRVVQNDTLKYVLSEVLRDLREQGRCYVKHEVKQGCFHITTR